jgi:hypothetical protein
MPKSILFVLSYFKPAIMNEKFINSEYEAVRAVIMNMKRTNTQNAKSFIKEIIRS